MTIKTVLAIDLGAESGRVMVVHIDDGRLRFEELHRFANTPVMVRNTLQWDVLRLWYEIQFGISKCKALHPLSMGIDTWGVDFALLDSDGNLLGNPVHYRDRRTDGMMALAQARAGNEWLFENTGIQFIAINSLYQLLSLVEAKSPQLQAAHTFLTIPDLFNYWLTGAKYCEFSNATTTQLFNPRAGTWAENVMAVLGIPRHIFPPIIQPGTCIGTFEGIPVIAPACHDTGSAVASVPTQTNNYAYISSGTWSLVGMEVSDPIINADALNANVTNEGGVAGTYRLLKNVMGLWIIQQCRATWAAEGHTYTYAELTDMAKRVSSPCGIIDPNDIRLLPPGNHPQLIQTLCRERGQPVPHSHAEIVRCILDSLAATYASVINTLQKLTGKMCEVVHIVGGGSQNELLCQLTANATNLPVLAGPIEATVLGNALMQFIALGEIDNLAQARAMVARSIGLRRYMPGGR
jgi:rhamnulokinase